MNFTSDYCEDCGGCQFVDYQGDYTCLSCGLVMMERMITDDKEWRNFSEEYNGSHQDRSRVGAVDCDDRLSTFIGDKNGMLSHINNMIQPGKAREDNIKDTFMHIETVLTLPESVMEYAKRMLNEYFKKSTTTFKGESRKLLFVSAAVLYASKCIPGAVRSSTEICNALCLNPSAFHRVCTQLNEVLLGTEFDEHMANGEVEVTDTLTRMVRGITEIPESMVFEVRKKVLLIYDKVKHDPTISTYASEKMNAALIYMACMFMKLSIKMKRVAECCCTSLTTIINIERAVKEVLSKH